MIIKIVLVFSISNAIYIRISILDPNWTKSATSTQNVFKLISLLSPEFSGTDVLKFINETKATNQMIAKRKEEKKTKYKLRRRQQHKDCNCSVASSFLRTFTPSHCSPDTADPLCI